MLKQEFLLNDDWAQLAGVDEAGRGPLAGPVVAAAVILGEEFDMRGLSDSKKLSAKKRETLSRYIINHASSYAIGRVDHQEIDELNILNATMLAMRRAIEGLSITPKHVLIDGNKGPDIQMQMDTIVKGDEKIPCISAASIIAKVSRDQEMLLMDKAYPGYGFAKHKGYPTKEHIQALDEKGVCPIHRHSYAPVRQRLS